MADRMPSDTRIVIFTCNWNAHQSLQEAGRQRLALPVGARALKVDCLGQLSSSVVLKTLEKGADGVMLVGCSEDECHYEFGSRRAAELFQRARQLAGLLGFHVDRLQFHQIHAGEAAELIDAVQSFASLLAGVSRELA